MGSFILPVFSLLLENIHYFRVWRDLYFRNHLFRALGVYNTAWECNKSVFIGQISIWRNRKSFSGNGIIFFFSLISSFIEMYLTYSTVLFKIYSMGKIFSYLLTELKNLSKYYLDGSELPPTCHSLIHLFIH